MKRPERFQCHIKQTVLREKLRFISAAKTVIAKVVFTVGIPVAKPRKLLRLCQSYAAQLVTKLLDMTYKDLVIAVKCAVLFRAYRKGRRGRTFA